MKKLNLIALILVFGFFSCSKQNDSGQTNTVPPQVLKFNEIRQALDLTQVNQFVESSQFQSLKKPNIYFIFFDTLRPDLANSLGPNFHAFYQQNLKFEKAYASGTATVFSTFSLFHSNPGFLAYSHVPSERPDHQEYGSTFLKVLEKLGYKLNVYGFYWNCVQSDSESGASWDRFLVSFFGWKTRLLDRCKTDTKYDAVFGENRDEVTVERLKEKLVEVIKPNETHFTYIAFYNNHDNYKWGSATREASTDVGIEEDVSKKEQTKNRYKNSVLASDKNFKEILNLIKTLPGYDDSVIVLLSDHGEMLFEKKDEVRHGGIPFQEKINTVLSFKFTKDSNHSKNLSDDSLASIVDIFLTLFDYMEISPAIPSHWYTGQSLISRVRNSALVIQSNGHDPTNKMVLVNKSLKAWIRIEEKDFYHSSSFVLTDVTDLNDHPIPTNQHPCFEKSAIDCANIIRGLFPEAIGELYPKESLAAANKSKLNEKRKLAGKKKK